MDLNIAALIERAKRQLVIRNQALARTLEEINLLEGVGPAAATALRQAQVKRNRQHDACEATKQLIATLEANRAPKRPK